MAQKMAMRQEEPVIVKPMPGRPNLQNPPRRGRGHFVKGAILFLGAELCKLLFISVCNGYEII